MTGMMPMEELSRVLLDLTKVCVELTRASEQFQSELAAAQLKLDRVESVADGCRKVAQTSTGNKRIALEAMSELLSQATSDSGFTLTDEAQVSLEGL